MPLSVLKAVPAIRMSLHAVLGTLLLVGVAGAQSPPRMEFAIAIHGGAGKNPGKGEAWKAKEEALTRALTRGHDMLAAGATSLDTVEAVVRILEDDPSINAGRGAVLNTAGGHELDATIMEGKTRRCGSIGGVTTVRNPISLARKVMEQSPHVLLVTDGAEKFADRFSAADGIERVPNNYFSTEARLKEWEENRKKAEKGKPMGTTGCVCLDKHGNLAAATSTGGTANKLYGRLGDSPIVGAGTYADNRTCAVSCTGVGEDFIRYAVSYDINARMRYAGQSLQEASQAVLNTPDQVVRGGLVSVDAKGNIAMEFNTGAMSRAAADSSGRFEVHVSD
ncbi:Isoaspartyl peptidase precursor [Caulifigura coniformis]|uniref:Isoaspartyl peptidase n=1 Tax=Caulifigura coniformis TaxID=2527983 RepID=A0A517S7N2_9PLAN|nr:isoaspartyl peptidase/L-asparaginase [Caulifigura coniformis]QDT52125.1 Isoaspartyl peptidase precursor [Caulifigura coniformis]